MVEILSKIILYNSLYLTLPIKEGVICDILSVCQYILLISLIIYYVKGKYNQDIRSIGLTKEKFIRNVFIGFIGGIGATFLIIGEGIIVLLVCALLGSSEIGKFVEEVIECPTVNETRELFTSTQPFKLLIYYFLVDTVLIPFSEEMFFRGFVYLALRKLIGIRWAMVLSALFFGLWHTHPRSIITGPIVGIVLAYLYERTKSLIPCIVGHSLINAKSAILVYFFKF